MTKLLGHYRHGGDDASSAHVMVVGESVLDHITSATGEVWRMPGGSPANVAVRLARHGIPVAFHTAFGNDDAGLILDDWLTSAGVSVTRRDDVSRTSTAVTGPDGTYTFHLGELIPETLPAPDPAAGVLHTGSLAAHDAASASLIMRYLLRSRRYALTSVNPNVRPAAAENADATRGRLMQCLSSSDIVTLSVNDLAWLAPNSAPIDVVNLWLRASGGPSLVVLTAGSHGLTIFTPMHSHVEQAADALVVDTVGAGDAVTASVLLSLWRMGIRDVAGRSRLATLGTVDLKAIAEAAVRAAAVTVGHVGATSTPSSVDLREVNIDVKTSGDSVEH